MTGDTEKIAFVDQFGGIYEHSPWVAERVWDVLPGIEDLDAIAAAMAACVEAAGKDRQLELLCAHPDLAGRAAVAGELTADSNSEQASAGIDQCSKDEFAQFQELNAAYREKFGFPFIMAVRDSNRHAILAAFTERVGNDTATEFRKALNEVHKIARLRLEALAPEDHD